MLSTTSPQTDSCMSVLFIIPYNPLDESGGLQNRTVRQAKALAKLGCRTEVWSTGQSGERDGVSVRGFKSFGALLARVLSVKRYRVVHWMELWPNTACVYLQHLTAYLQHLRGVRSVLTVATLGNMRSRGGGSLGYAMTRRGYEAVTVLNEAQVGELVGCGIPKGKVHLFHCGLDPSKDFVPVDADTKARLRAQLNLPSERPIVLYLGRMVERKRVELLVHLWLDEPTFSQDALLLLVGSSWHHEDSADAKIGAMLAGIDRRSILKVGSVSAPWLYYQSSDFLVTLSLREGESNTVVEAMSCGIPVVGSDIPGINSIVNHEVSGLLFDPFDSALFVQYTKRLIEDECLRLHMGREARRQIEATRGISAIARQYLDLYRSL